MKRLVLLLVLMVSCTACVLAQNQNFPGGGAGGTFGPNYSVGGGIAQAQTVSPTGAVTNVTLVNGYTICWLPIAANTAAAPTLAGGGTSTFTAKSITKVGAGGLTALIANDIVTTAIACAIYDGTEFQLQNPQAGIVVSGSINIGSGASAAGATATGGFAEVEAASTGWTPTVGQDYMRADSTLHNFVCSLNGVAESLCGSSISGLTTGFLPKASSATAIANSLVDEGVTTANTLTVGDTAGITLTTGGATINNSGGNLVINANSGAGTIFFQGGAFAVAGGGNISRVSSVVTAGPLGVPIVLYATNSASTNTNIGATTMYAGNNGTAQTYRFSWYIEQTGAGTSCVGTTTVTLNYIFQSPNASGSTTVAAATVNVATSGNGAVGNVVANGTNFFAAKNNTNIQYSTTAYTAGGSCVTSPSYTVYPRLIYDE